MATHTFVYFEHEEAAELARLQSIKFDLQSTVQLCEFFEEQCAQSAYGYAGSEITDAFSTAILVRYSRAFVSGVRRGIGSVVVENLPPEQRENHQRIRAFRDKHIAHSVNAFESTRVQARYCLERVEQEGITGVSTEHHRVIGLSSKDVTEIQELCRMMMGYLDSEIEKEKTRLLAILRSMPVSEVLSRPAIPARIPDHSQIDKRRPRA